MTIELNKLVDDRNRQLWEELNSNFNIKIEKSLNLEYSCFNVDYDSTIYVVPNNLCPASFTHELLHIYLRLHSVYIGAGFSSVIQGSNILRKIFSASLFGHIGNCLDHIKMFQLYEDMGFDADKFILDFHKFKCTPTELADLKRYYRQGNAYSVQAVDFFIGKYIAIQADFNDEFDYEICLTEMKKLDPVLYGILERFIIKWEEFDIEGTNIVHHNYHIILNKMYEDMKFWLSKKIFI